MEVAPSTIVIYEKRCKACGICLALCPRQVIAANSDGKPVPTAPERCTACGLCETHCPDLAIVIRRTEDA